MNVLSLFDGMSCGQIALTKAGIPYENYYASEIDPHAIKVARENFPSMIHVGDVTQVKGEDLPNIDLLIGGSPCQGFSFSGKKLNFDDPRSKLFFEFVRLLKEKKPKYFLLENVVMKKESMDVITETLGVNPIKINSSLVSAQSRTRLYWTNIPDITIPEDKNILLKDVLEEKPENVVLLSDSTYERFKEYGIKIMDGTEDKARCLSAMEYVKNGKQGNYLKCDDRGILVHNIYGGFKEDVCRVFVDKSPTIRANSGGGALPSVFYGTPDQAQSIPLKVLREKIRKLTVLECKRLQTVPDDYKMNVSNSQAYKMLGNGWTVDVIVHILKGIKNAR